MNTLMPFIKWAGGKRQLLKHIRPMLPIYKNYYEPFIGGGALLFDTLPPNAYINDINKELINLYIQIRDNVNSVIEHLKNICNSIDKEEKIYYLEQRELFNYKILNNEYDSILAALFIYINKRCFNGLYRVNSKGIFNTSFGLYSKPISIDYDNLIKVSNYLKHVTITNSDFEVGCSNATNGDFVFLDSPYIPLSNTSFQSYTSDKFTLNDHIRVSKLFDELTIRGCLCITTNHYTELTQELYGQKGYHYQIINVIRSINSVADKRYGKEIIICNYDFNNL